MSGRFVFGGDIAASVEGKVHLLVPENSEYRLYSIYDLEETVTGLDVLNLGFRAEGIVVSTPEKVFVLGNRQGSLFLVWQSEREVGADFSDVAAGDLDGDGRGEIVVSSAGREAVYVYSLNEGVLPAVRFELAGIRAVPGIPGYVEIFKGPDGSSAIAVAYQVEGRSGVATYFLREEGFIEGPVLDGQPVLFTAFTSGNFTVRPGEELAVGTVGGMVWVLGANRQIEVLLITESLGPSVSAVAPSMEPEAKLAAGTPEGNVYIFNYPVNRTPDLRFSPVEGVTGLAFLPGRRIAVGTQEGSIQVWSMNSSGKTWKYIVKPGDTLWSISKRHGITVEKILSLNQNIRNPEVIMPGQVIRLPAG
ncbi:MAG: LysM peptidoglycan-binding domain-containing protein [Bacillota bacterium]